ncbi:MAG: hypothetical protein IKM07_07355, partial [Clostridia bacterium]|nr:hypothetical protein [Clostridia bacterium]
MHSVGFYRMLPFLTFFIGKFRKNVCIFKFAVIYWFGRKCSVRFCKYSGGFSRLLLIERGTQMSKKYVYLFTEGNGSMRELLGGKGANLAEMTNIGMPVPQGFT